ncbi:lamin tail domain-containing protein [Candidatus Daviesbacteria bacterium]|nr:lamin tail domain-containing protein [Candidatus Daviesbacteria bacterium]
MRAPVILLVILFFGCTVKVAWAAASLDVVLSEVMWMGTTASAADEWIELYNNTNSDVDITGWGIYEAGGSTLVEDLSGMIGAKSYYLIERTDDNTISNVTASQPPTSWGGSGLNNSGEHLVLKDQNGIIVDEVNALTGWFAGSNSSTSERASMERINFNAAGSDAGNWATNNKQTANARDAAGNVIWGTPKAANSQTNQPTSTPPTDTPTPTPTPIQSGPTPTPTPTLTPTPTPQTTATPKPTTTPKATATPTPIPKATISSTATPNPTQILAAQATNPAKKATATLTAGKEASISYEIIDMATSEAHSTSSSSTAQTGQDTNQTIGGILLMAGALLSVASVGFHLFQKRKIPPLTP